MPDRRDGVHSVIRRELFGGDNARFLGMIAWRGVIQSSGWPPHISRDKATNWMGSRPCGPLSVRTGKLMNFVGHPGTRRLAGRVVTMQGTPRMRQ